MIVSPAGTIVTVGGSSMVCRVRELLLVLGSPGWLIIDRVEINVSEWTPARSVGDLTTLVKATLCPATMFDRLTLIKLLDTEKSGKLLIVLETNVLPDGNV